MVFVPSLSHTSWVEQKTQQQLNKQNKQTRACFLVLGRCLCVWDKAGLNSTVPSLCNWLRRLRSVTYSFIALSLFMSLCSGSLRHTSFNHMLQLPIMTKHTETHLTDMSSELCLSIDFPPPPPHFLSRPHIFLSQRYTTIPCTVFKGSRFA